ncbi:PAB-dependent polyA-specific ribonuclease subunit PAN3 [Sarcoptes scabiei]|nr:PAB-dependent polyA-specific ribonuclease subunit PAN3 [Sarcoptes scabiei]
MFTFFSINNFFKYLITIFLLIILLIIITNEPFNWFRTEESEPIDSSPAIILARLSRATAELAVLKSQNEELQSLVQRFISKISENDPDFKESLDENHTQNANSHNISLDYQYEFSRRKLSQDISELWNFIRFGGEPIEETKIFVKELTNSLLYDLDVISQRDIKARKDRLNKLSNYLQLKIHQLQNPKNCENARKLVCTLNKGCGFGCQIHHVAYCMVVAIATNRTLILNSQNWRYVNKVTSLPSLWNLAFKSISETCVDDSGSPRIRWSSAINRLEYQVIDLPILDSLKPKKNFLPLAIPDKISLELTTLHGAPFVWFIGQILRYLMRPSEEINDYIRVQKNKLNFRKPIVGVHVRRTDKINTEASFHSLSEYMNHVEHYYDRLDVFRQRKNPLLPPSERLVYLATDDVTLWKKEIDPFEKKGYKFIGDSEISGTASMNRRYSYDSLKNIILDIWLLSESDFLVCTFSSQVCRLAYELMQSIEPGTDRSADFSSLDDIYYFGGQNSHSQIAILNHKASSISQISFKIGDIIGIAGNHWNGFSKGSSRVTQQNGLYPSFKAKDKIETAKFELFQD